MGQEQRVDRGPSHAIRTWWLVPKLKELPGPSQLLGRPGEFEAVYGQFAKWNEFSRVFQLKLPLLGMYSLAYQNVQSFWGSIDKLL